MEQTAIATPSMPSTACSPTKWIEVPHSAWLTACTERRVCPLPSWDSVEMTVAWRLTSGGEVLSHNHRDPESARGLLLGSRR